MCEQKVFHRRGLAFSHCHTSYVLERRPHIRRVGVINCVYSSCVAGDSRWPTLFPFAGSVMAGALRLFTRRKTSVLNSEGAGTIVYQSDTYRDCGDERRTISIQKGKQRLGEFCVLR